MADSDQSCGSTGTLMIAHLDEEDYSKGLVCPITTELFLDPVLCVGDGYTYEREAVEKWFADGHTTSPMSGLELGPADRRLVPNFNVRQQADSMRGGAPEHMIRSSMITPEKAKCCKKRELDPSLNQALNDCARNTNDSSRLRDLVERGAVLTSTNGAPWHHTPLHQAAYHNRPEQVSTLMALCAEQGVLEEVLAMRSNPCGRGGSGTPMDLARGGGHSNCVDILTGSRSSPYTQTMERLDDLPPGVLPAEELQGTWGYAFWPACWGCEHRQAQGRDVLVHQGCCFPFFMPYVHTWYREGQTNTFRKRNSDERLRYTDTRPGFVCFDGGCTLRFCGKS